MYVPNYIPEPLEVPGNITLLPYRSRVNFIRQVVWFHSLGLLLVAAFGFLPGRDLPSRPVGLVLIAVLLLLDLLRIRLRGKPIEAKVSALLLPIVLPLVGWSAVDLSHHGWPVWSVLCGGGSVLIYALACGRDFSFVGCFFTSWIISTVGIFGIFTGLKLSSEVVTKAMIVNFVYLAYSTYDLASLLARRRKGEALAAVVDLYRDVFNFIGYFWRCLHHWKKHKIWAIPNKPVS